MPRYEYKVVPAPAKGLKGKGIKGAEARFAHALQELMNDLAGDGWEYQRAETLPSTERSGLTGSTTEWRNMLVFRRLSASDAEAFAPELLPAPMAIQPADEEPDQPQADATEGGRTGTPEPEANDEKAAVNTDDEGDTDAEDADEVADIGDSLESLAKARQSGKTET